MINSLVTVFVYKKIRENMPTNATGIWTVSDYGSTPNFTAGKKGSVLIDRSDREILKRLAVKVKQISLRPQEAEKRRLWKEHNMLKTKQPVVFCDPENGWNEIITEDMVECSSDLARRWEVVLKKEIHWAEVLRDDKVIEPNFDIGYTYTDNNWGLDTKIHGGHGGAYSWDPAIKNIEDLDMMEYIKLDIDHKTTKETLELANVVFDGLLDVRLTGKWWWSLGLTIDLAFLRGLENILWDMVDNKELMSKSMQILSDGTQKKIDFLEVCGLLSSNVDKYVGSGGFGYTDELPAPDDLGDGDVKAKDTWGFGESQETGNVSPEMFEEFVFKYQLPILSRFGLNCYGCCEPLHGRWHIIKEIPNLRRVSVSPWADVEKMAEYLKDDYVFSVKPNPADLAVPEIDKKAIRKKIRQILDKTKGCVVEILMKDNHTLGKNPDNVTEWVKIVRQEIER